MTMLQIDDMRNRLSDKSTLQMALVDIGEWVKDNCLMMGSSPSTAFTVAAVFIAGLEEKPIESKHTGWRKRVNRE